VAITEREDIIVGTQPDGSPTVNEERILNKLDAIDARSVETLVAVTKLQEQMKDLPDLKSRINSLEKWRWTAMGALGTAATSLAGQLYSSLKAGG
jgi:hypothetical protein